MQLMTKLKFNILFFIVILLCAFYANAESKHMQTARQVAENFQAKLLEVMKQGKELGYQGRYEQLYAPITESHDLAKIARIVIGKPWKTLNAEQKKQINDVFTRLSVSSYAHNFKEYNGESFKFESEQETSRGGIIVRTLFIIPDDKDVKFDYMLKKTSESWRIINIIANGVSDLALKRSEYNSILKQEGFDGLIAKLTGKIERYSNQ